MELFKSKNLSRSAQHYLSALLLTLLLLQMHLRLMCFLLGGDPVQLAVPDREQAFLSFFSNGLTLTLPVEQYTIFVYPCVSFQCNLSRLFL